MPEGAHPDGARPRVLVAEKIGDSGIELLRTHFDALAKPRPELDGVKNPRTAEQRRHDALFDVLRLNLRAQLLPSSGGLSSTQGEAS